MSKFALYFSNNLTISRFPFWQATLRVVELCPMQEIWQSTIFGWFSSRYYTEIVAPFSISNTSNLAKSFLRDSTFSTSDISTNSSFFQLIDSQCFCFDFSIRRERGPFIAETSSPPISNKRVRQCITSNPRRKPCLCTVVHVFPLLDACRWIHYPTAVACTWYAKTYEQESKTVLSLIFTRHFAIVAMSVLSLLSSMFYRFAIAGEFFWQSGKWATPHMLNRKWVIPWRLSRRAIRKTRATVCGKRAKLTLLFQSRCHPTQRVGVVGRRLV